MSDLDAKPDHSLETECSVSESGSMRFCLSDRQLPKRPEDALEHTTLFAHYRHDNLQLDALKYSDHARPILLVFHLREAYIH